MAGDVTWGTDALCCFETARSERTQPRVSLIPPGRKDAITIQTSKGGDDAITLSSLTTGGSEAMPPGAAASLVAAPQIAPETSAPAWSPNSPNLAPSANVLKAVRDAGEPVNLDAWHRGE